MCDNARATSSCLSFNKKQLSNETQFTWCIFFFFFLVIDD